MIREILKMGDPRLLRIAAPVDHFDTPDLHALVKDMFETMRDANGRGSLRRKSALTCRS
jgi:peptide deformylase